MSDAADLYQEVVLEHSKHPCNYGVLEPCSHCQSGRNPLCGDEVTVYVQLEGGFLKKIQFVGQGCALSQASASLMTLALEGQSLDHLIKIEKALDSVLSDPLYVPDPQLDDALGDLTTLAGVSRFPARIRCAALPWHVLRQALESTQALKSRE